MIWLGGGIVDIFIYEKNIYILKKYLKKKKTNLLTAKPIKYGRVKSNFTLETYLKWGQ